MALHLGIGLEWLWVLAERDPGGRGGEGWGEREVREGGGGGR